MREQQGTLLCVILGLIGFGLAAYLMVPHLGLMRGEILGGAACGLGGAFNCHVVTGSRWGTLFGAPLALWGIAGYVVVMALGLLGRQSVEWAGRALSLIVLLVSGMLAADVYLFIVMTTVIRSLCLFCLLTYAVNLILLLSALRALGRSWPAAVRGTGAALAALMPSAQRPAAGMFWGMVLVGLLGTSALHAATVYISKGTLGDTRDQYRNFVARQTRMHPEVSGDPMIGSPGAPILIAEFSDMRCPVCQRASKLNPIILANHRDDVAFVFKHYPLDTACNDKLDRQVHPGACQLAAATECAHLQGKFWELHDRIFEKGKDYKLGKLRTDVQQLGLNIERFDACMSSGEGMAAVKRDIEEGKRLKVRSTPTYVINGIRMSGVITPASFEDLIAVIQEGR